MSLPIGPYRFVAVSLGNRIDKTLMSQTLNPLNVEFSHRGRCFTLSCSLNFCYSTIQRPIGALTAWQERRAKELMLRNVISAVKISDVAQHCYLSRSHFSRAFKKTTGFSPQIWLLQAKIEKAKHLLTKYLPITQIGLECGFSDHSHFTRTFFRLEGLTPRAWRRAFQISAIDCTPYIQT